MRRVRNIFEQDNHRGTGVRTMSAATIALLICSMLSGMAAIYIIVNFEAVTARIAVFMADLLSSGFLILVVVGTIVFLIIRLKWKLHRCFWGW